MISIVKKKGFTLVFSLLIVCLIVLICTIYFSITTNDLVTANRIANSMRAYYIADAGLADALIQLRATTHVGNNSVSASNSSYPVGPGLTGSYSAQGVSDGASWPLWTITSVGTYRGVQRTLTLQVKAVAVSKWNYISDSEIGSGAGGYYQHTSSPVWWSTGDIMTGPLFTNGQMNINGSPIFYGAVSQHDPAINYYNGGPPNDNPYFQYGITFGAPTINVFSDAEGWNNVYTAAQQSGGLLLTGITSITLLSNGTMNVTNAARSWTNQNVPIPTNGAVYVQDWYVSAAGGIAPFKLQSGDVTVRGTLNGMLTIGSANNITIDDNIRYNSDPRTTPTSTDMLGLVAQHDVIVYTIRPSGYPDWHDVEINGYVVARTGSFYVKYWDLIGLEGNMVQYGGLANAVHGAVGTFGSGGSSSDPVGGSGGSSGSRTRGYAKLQTYDPRLQNTPPLWFPPMKESDGRILYTKIKLSES